MFRLKNSNELGEAKFWESKSPNLTQQVYSKIKDLILMYEIMPGQKLQPQDLSEKLNVSRTPVREALAKLLQEGYISLIPNRGYYVNEITIDEAAELYDVREAVESYAIEGCIAHLTDEGLERLVNKINAYGEDVKGRFSRRRLSKDRDVHLEIADMARNKTLKMILEQVFERIIFKRSIEGIYSQERGQIAHSEHEEMLKYIRNKDMPKAVECIRRHIRNGKKNVITDLIEREELRKVSSFESYSEDEL